MRLFVATCVLAAAASAHAATIEVTTTAASRGNSDGLCSLGEAIVAANDDVVVDGCAAGEASVDDVIHVPAGDYILRALDDVDGDGAGLPTVRGAIDIEGDGDDVAIVERDASAPAFALLHVAEGAAAVTLRGLRFRGGAGAVSFLTATKIERCTFEANVGGVAAVTGNFLVMNDNVFIDNDNTAGAGGALDTTGIAVIDNCAFLNNHAVGQGGAVHAGGQGARFSHSTFDGNSSDLDGGAVASDGTNAGLTAVVTSSFVGNSAVGSGGALVGTSDVQIDKSWFLSNSAGDAGGAVDIGRGSIDSATFVDNSANDGGGVRAASTTIVNTTFAANHAVQRGGALFSLGDVDLRNDTIAGNTSDQRAGGAAFADGDAIGNTIVAGNTSGQNGFDCTLATATTSTGHNIVGDGEFCTFIPIGIGDQIGSHAAPIDARMDDLGPHDTTIFAGADVGGQVPRAIQTVAPLFDSPAVDAGDPSTPGTGGTSCDPDDERGVPRTSCDVGAVEGFFVDDCAVCDPDAECINGNSCTCNPGFTGDGLTCAPGGGEGEGEGEGATGEGEGAAGEGEGAAGGEGEGEGAAASRDDGPDEAAPGCTCGTAGAGDVAGAGVALFTIVLVRRRRAR